MQTSIENINTKQDKSIREIKEVMDLVLKLAHKKGASDASVSMNHDRGYSVNVRMNELETVAFNDEKALQVTVYFGDRHGTASSTDCKEKTLETMVQAACDIAKVSAEDSCSGLADKDLIQHTYPDLDLYHPWDLSTEDAIKMALDLESLAMAEDSRIMNSDGANLSSYVFFFGYANSYGCEGLGQSSRHSISCSLLAKLGEGMQRDYDYSTARNKDDLLCLDKLAKSTAARVVSRLGAKKIKTQKAPVIFSSRVSGGLFSSFISAINGSNLYRKSSFLMDSQGQAVFPDFVQIYEQPFLLRGLGSAVFDGEGVPTRNNFFVKNGVIEQYVLNSYTARKLGLKTSANCGGVHNLTIDPTVGDLTELLKKMGKGLLITEMMGQGVNMLTGDYSRGASGFWVEHGEIQYPVEEITVAGNLKDMFASIAAIGSDINPNSSTRCGSVLIPEMMIAGN